MQIHLYLFLRQKDNLAVIDTDDFQEAFREEQYLPAGRKGAKLPKSIKLLVPYNSQWSLVSVGNICEDNLAPPAMLVLVYSCIAFFKLVDNKCTVYTRV